jgi:hypothetical protein
MNTATAIDQTAAARADRDHAAIQALGIITKDDTENTATFFAHGTELCEFGKQQARRDRRDWLQLPTVGDGMTALRARVQAENRADHFVDLGGIYVGTDGRIVAERTLPQDGVGNGVELPRLDASEVGWWRLVSFAPDGTPRGLRTNVNSWLGRRRGSTVRLRTRDLEPFTVVEDGVSRIVQPEGREFYSVVSTRYVPYDLDAIAGDIERHMPADARVRVRYDRSRARIDVSLCNPHHYPDSTGAASVGEAHRLTLRVTTADDGTGGFKLNWAAERIRCVNLTLLSGENCVFHASHTRDDLVEAIGRALAAQGQVMEQFAANWREAWTSYYLDSTKRGPQIDGPEALRRMVWHGLVKIPGLDRDETWSAVKSAWDAEPGDSVAHVHNAITRAAHQAPTERSWADDDVEEQASDLLYQRVHVLRDIPEDDRAELDWS